MIQNHLLIEGWTANILNFAKGLSARHLPNLFENSENCLMIFLARTKRRGIPAKNYFISVFDNLLLHDSQFLAKNSPCKRHTK